MMRTLSGLDTDRPELQTLVQEVRALRSFVVENGRDQYVKWRGRIERSSFRLSCINLAAYVALRQNDLRTLQSRLMVFGLSSLGRCEARVLPNLDAVLVALCRLCGERPPVRRPTAARFFRGERLLATNTDAIFGKLSGNRRTRIMVTLGTQAASDYDSVRNLVARGMDCARINCAHDDRASWIAMVRNVRRAAHELGRCCTVCADIAGPRMRTAQIDFPAGRDRVVVGDKILLTEQKAETAGPGVFRATAIIPDVLAQIRPGQSVWIDEGRIQCTVDESLPGALMLSVTGARSKGEKLRPQKGLNFPGSTLTVSPLTREDLDAIDALANEVDMFGYSFVKTIKDVQLLEREIAARRLRSLPACGLVLKIENAAAVANLPDLIVESAGTAPTAVMIARGDLAIEIGYRRLAEMQEEILWLCEAAHVPVVWATQVLDNFVKKGRMSRAEFTDAAMAERADCVMLNKGPYVAEAISALDDVLARMETHQSKKTSRLRALHAWQRVP